MFIYIYIYSVYIYLRADGYTVIYFKNSSVVSMSDFKWDLRISKLKLSSSKEFQLPGIKCCLRNY